MKLLVATEFPPDAPGGGPAVVRQMLKDFPGEIHWWSCRPSVRGSSFRVPGSESWQGGKSAEVTGGGWRMAGFVVASFHCCPPGKLMPAKKLPKTRAFLMEHLWAPRATRSLRQAIEAVKPDCVWVIPHDWSILPIAKVFANDGLLMTHGKSPCVHASMHDFVDAHNFGDRVGAGLTRRMRRMQDLIYQNATTRDVICEPMGQHLQERTGKTPSFICRKGIDPEDFDYLESLISHSSSSISHQSSVIKIAYAGTILCESEFAIFVNLLDSLNQPRTRNQEPRTKNQEPRTKNEEPRTPNPELPPPSVITHQSSAIELHLYGAHSYADRPWFRPWIVEHGNLPERELLDELRKYDWGLSLMALDERDPIYNHFSFPAKFCTYFAAGLPVITLGHPETSVMKMAVAYNVGITIQSHNPSLDELARALFAPNSKQAHLPEILRCAREQFDAEKMRHGLWEAWGITKS
jgi:hypothetical protein